MLSRSRRCDCDHDRSGHKGIEAGASVCDRIIFGTVTIPRYLEKESEMCSSPVGFHAASVLRRLITRRVAGSSSATWLRRGFVQINVNQYDRGTEIG
jgi:hypothetical protein